MRAWSFSETRLLQANGNEIDKIEVIMVLDDPLIMVDPGVHFVDQPVRPRAQALDTNPRNPAHMLGPSPRFDVRPRAPPHACWARGRVSASASRSL